ncbi:MAG: T9SS type A sorting domain-containing protein [Sphingobacteriales bacterium JAD_PAG50586_3]|nr:MAG: T9SS type A sorting domain-containing protein [Sphingobacteriales bacterium JAD_PAG50586_3]
MKKIFYTCLMVLAGLAANAQNCSDLFISEYVEGSFNNKALEIYNPTGAAINLSDYRLIRWSNGTTVAAANEILPLPNATVASKDVYVIVINTTDLGTDTLPFADLAVKADVQLCTSCDPNSGSLRTMCFNGDDAISLEKNVNGTWEYVDIFGLIGEQPTGSTGGTAGWTNIPPYSSYDAGSGIPSNVYFLRYWTQNQTMIRKSGVVNGQKVNPGAPYAGLWNPATQWDTLPNNTFTELGAHVCDCNTVGVGENNQTLTATVYPNPATNVVNVRMSDDIKNITVFNMSGQLVLDITPENGIKTTKFDTNGLGAGLYLVRIETAKGTAIRKVTIN